MAFPICEESGKQVFQTYQEAALYLAHWRKQSPTPRIKKRVPKGYYRCRHCHGWHVTKVDQHRFSKRPERDA